MKPYTTGGHGLPGTVGHLRDEDWMNKDGVGGILFLERFLDFNKPLFSRWSKC